MILSNLLSFSIQITLLRVLALVLLFFFVKMNIIFFVVNKQWQKSKIFLKLISKDFMLCNIFQDQNHYPSVTQN